MAWADAPEHEREVAVLVRRQHERVGDRQRVLAQQLRGQQRPASDGRHTRFATPATPFAPGAPKVHVPGRRCQCAPWADCTVRRAASCSPSEARLWRPSRSHGPITLNLTLQHQLIVSPEWGGEGAPGRARCAWPCWRPGATA